MDGAINLTAFVLLIIGTAFLLMKELVSNWGRTPDFDVCRFQLYRIRQSGRNIFR